MPHLSHCCTLRMTFTLVPVIGLRSRAKSCYRGQQTMDREQMISDAAALIRMAWEADYEAHRAHINAVSMAFQDARAEASPVRNRRASDPIGSRQLHLFAA